MSLGDHLEELRARLIMALLALGIGIVICFSMGKYIIRFIQEPYTSVMTSYTRARAERHLAEFNLGIMERGERFVVLIAGALFGFLTLALWIVAIGATITSVQRLVVARRLLLELERTGIDPTAAPDEAESPMAEPVPLTREV